MTARWQQILSVIVILSYSIKCEFINRAAGDTTARPKEILRECGPVLVFVTAFYTKKTTLQQGGVFL